MHSPLFYYTFLTFKIRQEKLRKNNLRIENVNIKIGFENLGKKEVGKLEILRKIRNGEFGVSYPHIKNKLHEKKI